MKKIKNPWTILEGYNCFACSPKNAIGIKMEFFEDGEELICKWEPTKNYEGFTNVLHGGIQATLLDEMGAWVVARKMQTVGFTSKLSVKYHKTVFINQPYILIKAKLTEVKRNIAFIEARMYNFDEQLCASAEMCYFCTSQEAASSGYNFEGCFTEE